MKKFNVEYSIIEYITIAILSCVFIGIPVMHYLCLRNGWYNDDLAMFIYVMAIIAVIFMAITLTFFKNISFKWTTYETIFCVLLFCIFMSTFNSVDIHTSIWGTSGRNEGALMLLSYYTFFYLARFLKSDKSKYILVNIFLGVGVVHCAYGLCQYFDIGEASGWVIDSYANQKVISGVAGQFDFMATLTVMYSGLAAGLFYYSDKLWKKSVYLVLLALYLVTMLLTKAMSGYFGVLMMVVAFFIYLFVTRGKHEQFKNDKIFSSFNILVVMLIVGVIALISINKIMDNFIINELTTVFEQLKGAFGEDGLTDSFANYRGWIWKNTFKLVPHYLMFGVGVDALGTPLYYNFGYSPIKQYVDKAHNEYLQVLVTMGLPALIAYLTYYFLVTKDLIIKFTNYVNKEIKPYGESLYVGLFLTFIGYLFHAFFNISVIDVAPFFWILMGLIGSSMIEVQQRYEMTSNKKQYIKLPNGQVVEIMGTVRQNY